MTESTVHISPEGQQAESNISRSKSLRSRNVAAAIKKTRTVKRLFVVNMSKQLNDFWDADILRNLITYFNYGEIFLYIT